MLVLRSTQNTWTHCVNRTYNVTFGHVYKKPLSYKRLIMYVCEVINAIDTFGPVFKGQATKDRWRWNRQKRSTLRNIPEEPRPPYTPRREAWDHAVGNAWKDLGVVEKIFIRQTEWVPRLRGFSREKWRFTAHKFLLPLYREITCALLITGCMGNQRHES
jgi:hypothetical protein